MTIERWLPIPDYEGLYEVSNHGRVRSVDRIIVITYQRRTTYTSHRSGRILRPRTNERSPYPWVSLCRDGNDSQRFVHTLVLSAFVGPRPSGAEGCHRDDNPANNHVSNLRWDSHSENVMDIVRNGNHWQVTKTHCPQNHPYDDDNTYTGAGGRRCRKCNAEAVARYRAHKRNAIR